MSAIVKTLSEAVSNERSRARLLVVSLKELVWLHAVTVSSLDLRTDNNAMSIAVGLHLGAAICLLRTCCHCGEEVDRLATRGLSCHKSEGGHF